MSEDSFTEVTNESWFGRIGGAISGVVVGLVLFVIAFPLLFWNEGRAVKRYKTLNEGSNAVMSIQADTVLEGYDGSLVHLIGQADTNDTLRDREFAVAVKALHLDRLVEMYQWDESESSETRKKVGGGTTTVTTYSYDRVWAEGVIDSSRFKKAAGHQNPSSMPYRSRSVAADKVALGEFELSAALTSQIDNYVPLALYEDDHIPRSSKGSASIYDGSVYFGQNPADPQIGDIRISFMIVEPAEVSVVAQQSGDRLVAYKAKTGGTIALLRQGAHTADAMFEAAHTSNNMLTWVLRIVGLVLMLAGLSLMLRPASVLADVVPLFGSIVETGTFFISLLVASVLSFGTVAIAWLFYRPLLGIGLLVLAGGLTLLVCLKLKKKPSGSNGAPVSNRKPNLPPPPPAGKPRVSGQR